MNKLFIQKIILNRNKVENFNRYPFNISIIKNMSEINIDKPVTFIIGENGSGKSTIVEALALSMGLSAEGGTRNMYYETRNTTSDLYEYLTIYKSAIRPKWKFFLRAESFYTMANAYEDYQTNLHNQSHGEAFNDIFDNLSDNGLYIMDEPESALSPKNQMRFLIRMHDLAQNGSQFIIITHSPILLSYYDALILNADNLLKPINYKETEIYSTYKHFIDCPEKMQKYLFGE